MVIAPFVGVSVTLFPATNVTSPVMPLRLVTAVAGL
jgi:hypothetical protein